MNKIIVNKIKCKKCGDIIESTYRHDFKFCKCGAVAVDGGKDYLRRLGYEEDYEELSEVVPKQIDYLEEEWSDIGYYIDEYGYKRYGKIPKRNQQTILTTNDFGDDYAFNRTSDPRSRNGYLS